MKRKYLVKDRKKLQAIRTVICTRTKIRFACMRIRSVFDYKTWSKMQIGKHILTKGVRLSLDAQVKLWLMKRK